MDVEHLIGTMLQGALSGGRKRSNRAGRYLRGGGGSSFLNASTLLTIGGLVWGAIETMQQQGAQAPAPQPRPSSPFPSPPPPGPSPAAASSLPPLPGQVPAATGEAAPQPVPEGAAKLIRLMVSAARADGDLTAAERQTVLEHARAAGAESLVAAEIASPTPLARVVEGIDDARQRADLYVLAFGIVRADESVTGAERIYLAQLAAFLGLAPDTVEALEREAAARIDEAGAEDGTSGRQ